MSKKWLPMNLQFFAEGGEADEGAEDPEVADQDEEPEDEVDDSEDDSDEEEEEDRDSIYAAARRRAESEAKARYAKEQAERDNYYARLCEGKVNPETNQPITTEAEYREALDAQKRLSMTRELQEKGIDPNLINSLIANNPAIREAQRLVAETQESKAYEQVAEDIRTIMALDNSFADEDELKQSEELQSAIEYCRTHPGVRLSEAYKLVNFETLRNAGVKAAKQAAINETKGKGHLTSSAKTPKGKGSVEVPEAEVSRWKKFYPDKSMKEINALYARVHQ